jgi:hypothetical protein
MADSRGALAPKAFGAGKIIVRRQPGASRTQGWEGSRPRDPPFPKPRAFPDERREYTFSFENAFAARGDARPPCQGFLGLLRLTRMGGRRTSPRALGLLKSSVDPTLLNSWNS